MTSHEEAGANVRTDTVNDASIRSVTTSVTATATAQGEHDARLPSAKEEGDGVVDVPGPDASQSPSNGGNGVKTKPKADAGLKNFGRILGYSTPLDRVLMIIALIFSMGAGAGLPLMNIFFGRFANDFTNFSIPGSTFTESDLRNAVDRNALYVFLLFIAKFVLAYVSMFCYRIIGIRISAKIRLAYLTALFEQPISEVDKFRPGAATDVLTTTANTIQIGISDKLSVFGESLALVITAYAVAFSHSWALTLASTSSLIFLLIFYSIILPLWIKGETSINENNTRGSGVAGEAFTGIRTIKSLCAENDAIDKYAKWIARARRTGLKLSPALGLLMFPGYFAMYANMALTFWFGIKLYQQGHIDGIGDVVVVLFSVLLVVGGLGGLLTPIQGVVKAAAASTACFKVIDAPPRPSSGIKSPEAKADSRIAFENVRFTYPSRPRAEILRGLNLSVPAGKITALVGPSGCGKSTIVGLLERWYELSAINEEVPVEEEKDEDQRKKEKEKQKQAKKDSRKNKKNKKNKEASADVLPESSNSQEESGPIRQNSGTILVGDHSIESLDLKWWRTQIGLVQQEPFLFNESIYRNVAMGLVGSAWETETDETKRKLVEEACEEAFAGEFIRRLPQGYDTKVGEGGIKMSGGQRQRLAIARSIVKRPTILILDEATSAIDVRGEKIVQAALDRVSQGRTTITIAHRLSTIKKADQIAVLREGVVVEQGTHEELLSKPDGAYANLVQAQHLDLGEDEEEKEEILDEVDGIFDATTDDALSLKRTKSHGSAKILSPSASRVDIGQKIRDITTHWQSFLPAALRRKHRNIPPPNPTADAAGPLLEAPRQQRGFVSSVGLFLYEQRHHYIIYFLVLLSAAVAGGVYAAQSFVFSRFFVVFQYTGARLKDAGNFWSLMFFVLALAIGLCYLVMGYCTNHLSVHVVAIYRQQYFEAILGKPVAFFDHEDHLSGSLVSRLSNDPKMLQELTGMNLSLPLVSIFQIVACTILSFVFGWKLSLVVFFSTLPVILIAAFERLRYEMRFEEYNQSVFQESSHFAAESIGAFRTVAALTLEDSITSRFERLLNEHVSKAFRTARLAILIFSLSNSIDLACVALALWYGGRLIASREYDVAQFFLIFSAVVQGGQQAGQLLAFGPNVAKATAAANRIIDFRDDRNSECRKIGSTASPDSDDDVNMAPSNTHKSIDNQKSDHNAEKLDTALQDRVDSKRGGMAIEIQNINFNYPTRPTPVYRGLSLSIRPGGYIALVGPSGCGKSTAISLLARFYSPTGGSILVDGQNMADIPLGDYRAQIALVSQEPTLFEGTIRENLVFGLPRSFFRGKTEPDIKAAVEDVCRQAEVHEFVSSLPDGYDTLLAQGLHSSLSGGQRQRLCIARALIRKPRLLLLDEATSALDSVSERFVQKAIEGVAGHADVTVVVVAHRLATIQGAEQIFVMGEGGNIVETGTHKELIRQRGLYWGMCRAQALDR